MRKIYCKYIQRGNSAQNSTTVISPKRHGCEKMQGPVYRIVPRPAGVVACTGDALFVS